MKFSGSAGFAARHQRLVEGCQICQMGRKSLDGVSVSDGQSMSSRKWLKSSGEKVEI